MWHYFRHYRHFSNRRLEGGRGDQSFQLRRRGIIDLCEASTSTKKMQQHDESCVVLYTIQKLDPIRPTIIFIIQDIIIGCFFERFSILLLTETWMRCRSVVQEWHTT